MSPQPAAKHDDTRDPKPDLQFCQDCQSWEWTDLGHYCDQKPRMAWRGPLVALTIMLITILMILGVLWIAFSPNAARGAERATPQYRKAVRGVAESVVGSQVQPIKAPQALLRARHACPNNASIVQCRSALVRAYRGVEWQRHARWHAQAATIKQITLDAITWAAQRYGVPASQMIGIGTCESHLYPFATNGQYKGWGQLSTRHRSDPIFRVVPWQDAYAEASHIARYIKAHGEGEWQCVSTGGLRW